jgi:excisionase family DNA binding protein
MSEDAENKQVSALPAVEPLLVRVEEAARILCLSRSTIYEMMDSGELPSIRRGRARRILVTAISEWVNRQTTPRAS